MATRPPIPPPRLRLAHAPWVCDPNFIVCTDDHLLAFYKAGYRADLRRMNGHAFLECRDCSPSSYFFALFSTQPYPMVTCYAIDRASYLEWDKGSEETPPTPELLYRLHDPNGHSHNPFWRPPR